MMFIAIAIVFLLFLNYRFLLFVAISLSTFHHLACPWIELKVRANSSVEKFAHSVGARALFKALFMQLNVKAFSGLHGWQKCALQIANS